MLFQTALWKESLGNNSVITTLNLSGVEQLTDMFFIVIEMRNIELPHLASIQLNGKDYLSYSKRLNLSRKRQTYDLIFYFQNTLASHLLAVFSQQ